MQTWYAESMCAVHSQYSGKQQQNTYIYLGKSKVTSKKLFDINSLYAICILILLVTNRS